MIHTIPEVREVHYSGGTTVFFDGFELKNDNPRIPDAGELLSMRMWNLPAVSGDRKIPLYIRELGEKEERLLHLQGYELEIQEDCITIRCDTPEGYVYALSTLKQILIRSEEGCRCETLKIRDWPVIEYRSMSTTFAWYAGYGRIGFDMQLWDYDKWKEFLNICADYKINQLNMCLYGYWPYEVEGYPESVYRDIKMKIWNPESEQWLEMSFTHPNLRREFLKELIAYGHRLGIRFFSYMGLNSYSGGYANAHREKRMKFPENNTFINDFDSLCLSDPTTIDYLKACMKAVVDQGFDGIDFEESEEAYWYCNCEGCKEKFWKGNNTAEETLHSANTWLLDILYKELKRLKPDIVIGIRAWRQPPLVRSEQLLQSMRDSIPEDVVLFWAPGQYVEDDEFDKWIRYFGKERIRARDTEAIGFAACFGRLIHPFRWNGLRAQEEPITQFIEEDIRQHRGSVKRQVAGINGYLFEWYGFFMAFFAHAWYSWGSDEEPEVFYQKATQTVFGDLSEDILYVMKHMLTIHECQINIFELKFPMAENKVSEQDIPRINQAIEEYPDLICRLDHILEEVPKDPIMAPFALHFKKWKVSLQRCRVIYDMALESLEYEKADSEEEKRKHLLKMDALNEQEFAIIRSNYLDVNPIEETGMKLCMIPNHEMRRVIHNLLDPAHKDETPIYLDVASLGWMWF